MSSSKLAVILMMTSSNENIFRVTGPLWGESTGHRWIPLAMASDAEFDVFFICTGANNRDAGDLRRHRAHYDVTLMCHGLIVLIMSKMYRPVGGDQMPHR